jgi:hypothetical protein
MTCEKKPAPLDNRASTGKQRLQSGLISDHARRDWILGILISSMDKPVAVPFRRDSRG